MKRFGRTTLIAAFAILGPLLTIGPAQAQQLAPGQNQIRLQQEQQAILALPEHPASQAPPVGDYLTLQNIQNWPPLPVDALHLPFWIIGHDNSGNPIMVLDDRQVNWAAIQSATAQKIQQSQWSGGTTATTSTTTLDTTDTNSPPSPGGGGTTNTFTPYNLVSLDTNGLWLQITNVDSTFAYANANNATDMVYAVWCAASLTSPWYVENEIWPPESNSVPIPFTVENLERSNLFVRVQDWTGVTTGGNTVPSWWLWMHFGPCWTNLTDTNLDASGNTLAYDYENQVDPNPIAFTASVQSDYVNGSNVPLFLNVQSGSPQYFSILIDSTNFQNSVWYPWNGQTELQATIPSTGWHDVWVGMAGSPMGSRTWQWLHINYETSPTLVITNPVTQVVSIPIIQIQGYCDEKLSQISYSISNSAGVLNNLPAFVTDQSYDNTVGEFTTNYFTCFDVRLGLGTNIVTIDASDFNGNQISTNYQFILDYSSKTNPPAVTVIEPAQNAEVICNPVTVEGTVSDPTAAVVVNDQRGMVARDGQFSASVPLQVATNVLSITATDVVGNTVTTNITVVLTTNVSVSVNPLSDSDLWMHSVNITGTISDPSLEVFVNGVQGTNNGDGTWSANSVPLDAAGKAEFNVTVGSPGGPPYFYHQEQAATQPRLYGTGYIFHQDVTTVVSQSFNNSPAVFYSTLDQNWNDGSKGQDTESSGMLNWTSDGCGPGNTVDSGSGTLPPTPWEACLVPMGGWNGWPPSLGMFQLNDSYSDPCTNYAVIYDTDFSILEGEGDLQGKWNTSVYYPYWPYGSGDATKVTQNVQAAIQYKFYAPGEPGDYCYVELQGNVGQGAPGYNLPAVGNDGWGGTYTIPQNEVTYGSLGPADTNGIVYAIVPCGKPIDVTPSDPAYPFLIIRGLNQVTADLGMLTASDGHNYYEWTDGGHFTYIDNPWGKMTPNGPQFCVGQHITFDYYHWSLPVISQSWILPGQFVNQAWSPSASCQTYTNNPSLLEFSPQFFHTNINFYSTEVSCWFVDGPSGPVTVNTTYQLPDGKTFTEAASANISIYKPAVTAFDTYENPPRSFLVTGSFPSYQLIYGNPGPGSDSQRQYWKATLQSDYYGNIGELQLVNASYSVNGIDGNTSVNTQGQWWLDGNTNNSNWYPFDYGESTYVPGNPDQSSIQFEDFPGTQYSTKAEVTGNFQDWIEFQPADPAKAHPMISDGFRDPGSIMVPLAQTTWTMDGEAYLGSITTNYVPIPAEPEDTDTFPTWPQIQPSTNQQ